MLFLKVPRKNIGSSQCGLQFIVIFLLHEFSIWIGWITPLHCNV